MLNILCWQIKDYIYIKIIKNVILDKLVKMLKLIADELLQEVLQLHKLWLNDNNQGKRAMLHSYDLSYRDFSYAILEKAVFRGSDISNANFSGAKLDQSDFSDCILNNTTFNSASLVSCNLSHVIELKSDFRWTNLSGANLTRANFSGTNFSWANLIRANLTGTIMKNTKRLNIVLPDGWSLH